MDVDDELSAIARLQRGDIGGLELLVRNYHPRAVRCAYLVVHDHALALDIAQSAFVRVFERISRFDTARPFAPWFFKLVLRDARKVAERRARGTPLEASVQPSAADPDPSPEARSGRQPRRTAAARGRGAPGRLGWACPPGGAR